MEIPGKRRILNRLPMDDSVARFVSARAILDATAVLEIFESAQSASRVCGAKWSLTGKRHRKLVLRPQSVPEENGYMGGLDGPIIALA